MCNQISVWREQKFPFLILCRDRDRTQGSNNNPLEDERKTFDYFVQVNDFSDFVLIMRDKKRFLNATVLSCLRKQQHVIILKPKRRT